MPKLPQHCPWSPYPTKFGADTQDPIPNDESKPLEKKGIKFIQQVVGDFLNFCHTTDTTNPKALSELSQQQANVTRQTME